MQAAEIREADPSEALAEDGYVVIDGLYPDEIVDQARKCVLDNIGLLRNTRPNPSAGHLAGFHRFPEFGPLHDLLAANEVINDVLRKATNGRSLRAIGLTDITVNRSQPWHVDLLRGKYRFHLNSDICWGPAGGGVYKALLYLQAGKSLKVIPGAHARPIALDSDRNSRPSDQREVRSIGIGKGSVILMDLRLPHCGSSEEELRNDEFLANPKILVSTVLGDESAALTSAMEAGNLERLLDWDALHEGSESPRLLQEDFASDAF